MYQGREGAEDLLGAKLVSRKGGGEGGGKKTIWVGMYGTEVGERGEEQIRRMGQRNQESIRRKQNRKQNTN